MSWNGGTGPVLPMVPTQYPMADSLIRFTRGLGMARTGNLAGAKDEIEATKALRTTLQRADQSYWAGVPEAGRALRFKWTQE
jgi:hypothetical protein